MGKTEYVAELTWLISADQVDEFDRVGALNPSWVNESCIYKDGTDLKVEVSVDVVAESLQGARDAALREAANYKIPGNPVEIYVSSEAEYETWQLGASGSVRNFA